MKWWQTQEFIGTMRQTIGNSTTGENRGAYLSQRDFLKMMGIAFAVHVVFFVGLALFPDETVTNIPVRALSFKLGDQDRIAAYDPTPGPASTPAAPVMKASASAPNARVAPTPPKPVKPAKIEPIVKPHPKPLPPQKPQEETVQPQLAPLPVQPAVASTPQQYVREVGQVNQQQQLAPLPQKAAGNPDGAIGGVGNQNSQTEKTSKEIRDRYEQQISGWIERHKVYPAEAGGREGRVIVRMRIDRSGVVRYYALEQSCGVTAIDNAALDMIRRANPVPSAPINYPAGNLIEFLIPITFKAP